MKKAAILWVLASGLFVATSASAQTCVGDCNGDGMVAINELITGVNIALGCDAAVQPVRRSTSTATAWSASTS